MRVMMVGLTMNMILPNTTLILVIVIFMLCLCTGYMVIHYMLLEGNFLNQNGVENVNGIMNIVI